MGIFLFVCCHLNRFVIYVQKFNSFLSSNLSFYKLIRMCNVCVEFRSFSFLFCLLFTPSLFFFHLRSFFLFFFLILYTIVLYLYRSLSTGLVSNLTSFTELEQFRTSLPSSDQIFLQFHSIPTNLSTICSYQFYRNLKKK